MRIFRAEDSPLTLASLMKDSDFNIEPMAIAFYSGFWAFAGWCALSFCVFHMFSVRCACDGAV